MTLLTQESIRWLWVKQHKLFPFFILLQLAIDETDHNKSIFKLYSKIRDRLYQCLPFKATEESCPQSSLEIHIVWDILLSVQTM